MSHDAGDAAFDFRDCSVTLDERAFPPGKTIWRTAIKAAPVSAHSSDSRSGTMV